MYLVTAVFVLSAGGCGNDDGGPIPDGTDNCLQPTFTSIHTVVSSALCANAGCHAGPGAATSGRLDLSGSTAEVYARLVGVMTNDLVGISQFPLRIEAGAPDTSYFLHMVEAAEPVGSSLFRMPPGGVLAECDIAAIRDWISAGALEN